MKLGNTVVMKMWLNVSSVWDFNMGSVDGVHNTFANSVVCT